MWNQNFIELLNAEFEKLRARNPRISMRGFARILGVSASTIFRLTSGSLTISSERALQMLENLPIEPDRLNELIFLMNHPYKAPTTLNGDASKAIFEFEGNLELAEIYKNELYGLLLRLSHMSMGKPRDARIQLNIQINEKPKESGVTSTEVASD